MAASCSRDSSSDSAVIPYRGWKKLSDSVFEVSRPSQSDIDLEVIFLHGFGSKSDTDSYYRTWMKTDGSGNWLDTSLPESFPRARILSVSYDASLMTSFCTGRLDMYLLGESLLQSLVDLAGVGQRCPVVLVGHCLGGMVLKKIVLFASREKSSRSFSHPYETFLRHLKGAFFFSTPNLGADLPLPNVASGGGPLLEYLKLLGTESARMNAEFADLRNRYKWKTFGVFAANQTETAKFLSYLTDVVGPSIELESVPRYISIVAEGSARADMDKVCVISDVDHFTISQSSTSFAHLIHFLTKIVDEEEDYRVRLQRSFGLHAKVLDLDHRVDAVIKKLQLEKSEPLHLALVGIDGIGKSTLVKQVVNIIRHQFEYICHVELEGVDRSRRSKQIEKLVVQNLCYPSGRSVEIDEGRQPWSVIRGKKVLMIFDDVDSEEEISEFLTLNWCGEGSRLIITSSWQGWSQLIVHQVPFLSQQASYQLFVTYLDETVLRLIPWELMSEVVAECDGLPLVLEIIGKYLRNKRDVNIWSGAIKRLQMEDSIDGRSGENALWKKLQVSFQSLAELERNIFLDLTTFDVFPPEGRQYDLGIFRSAWRASFDSGVVELPLLNLEERSFLIPEMNNPRNVVMLQLPNSLLQTIRIHKQLRHMGRWISRPAKRDPEECRWISQFSDLQALLLKCKAASNDFRPKTEVLSMDMGRKKRVAAGSDSPFQNIVLPVQWNCMSRLEALRLLRISNMHFMASDELKFPFNLALLHMRNCTRMPQKENWWLPYGPLSSWPLCDEDIMELRALSVLILEDCSFVQLPQSFYMLQDLKVLQIHSGGMPMGPLPENLGFLPALKYLSLNVSLKRLPSSLLQLPSLESFELSGDYLQAWPTPTTVDPYCHLKALRKLHLKDLPSLVELPDTFGGLASLEKLIIERCSALKKLPEGFGALSKLRSLSIDHCRKLETLCESLSGLSQLHHLRLSDCDAIKELPGSFASLPSVLSLGIFGCDALESLWQVSNHCRGNQGLEKLETLWVEGCDKFRDLPKSLDQLKSLKVLEVSNCRKFRYNPDSLLYLTSVREISINDNYRYKGFDDDERALSESRRSLSTLSSTEFENIPTSIGLPGPLQELDGQSFGRFGGAGVLDSATYLPGLKWLGSQDYQYTSGAPQSLVQWSSSTSLPLEDCSKPAEVPGSVRQLSNLRELTLTDCELTSTFVRGFGSLEALHVERCRGVAHLLETMTMWTGMKTSLIHDCETFSTMRNSLGYLTSLTVLTFEACPDLVSLPESIGQLSSLRSLIIRHCRKLKCLPESVGKLKNLTELIIKNCRSISALPDALCHMTWLQRLEIECQLFSSLPSPLGNLTPLTVLKLVNCQDLTSLPESIGQLTSLRELEIRDCSELTCLPVSLGQLKNLEDLRIENCRSILTLPSPLGNLTPLTVLKLVNCHDLTSLPESIGQLTSLCELEIRNCSELTCLPVSLGQLRNLESLFIEDCRSILTLPHSVYHMTWLQKLRIFDYRPFESLIMKSLKEFTRLDVLDLSTWNGLICLKEFLDSVTPGTFRLPQQILVKCMECEDTVVPPIKDIYHRRFLNRIDDSCGCIHVIGILKYLESYLSYRGSLKIIVAEYSSRDLGSGRMPYGPYVVAGVTVVCGRVKVEELPWRLKICSFDSCMW